MFIYKEDNMISEISHCSTTVPASSMYSKHYHREYELYYILRGNVNFNIDGAYFALKPYDLVFVPTLTEHFVSPMSDEEHDRYVINFDARFFDVQKLGNIFSPPYVINIRDDMRLRRMFELFDYFYETYLTEDFKVSAENLFKDILINLTYKPKEIISHSEVNYNLILKITAYISKNIETELSSGIIAEQMNFSKSYIQNQFSKTMGIGLQTYINRKKIYAAHSDILNGMSPYRAAEKYCYNDYSSFFRQYKKIFNISPKNSK